MDNNNIPGSAAFKIMEIVKNANDVIEMAKNGDGLGLTEEQKNEFKQKIQDQGTDMHVKDLQNKIEQLKEAVLKMNTQK